MVTGPRASIGIVPSRSAHRLAHWLAAALVIGSSVPAQAQDEVLHLPIRSLSPAELASVEPLLSRAVVAHIEHTEHVELPLVTVLGTAEVSCADVVAVARDVASYPTFMPALDTVALETSDAAPEAGSGVGYAWTWQASVLSFRGAATVQVLEGGSSGAFRVIFESIDGDLGRARRVLRGTPLGGERCLLALSGRHDARGSNYLTRTAAGTGLALSRTLSLVLSIATVTRLRGEAERRAGRPRTPIAEPLGDPRTLVVDPFALEGLLARGEAFVLETTDGSDLGAIVGLSRLAFPTERVRAAFFDPVHFTTGLLSGASITEVSREAGLVRYRWAVDVPLLGSSGTMTIRDVTADEVELEATEGAMRGGRMVLTTRSVDPLTTYATLASRIDPSDGVPIVAAIESTDPAFRPGLVASGLLMAFRGLRRGLTEGR